MLEKSYKTSQSDLLYSNKNVVLTGNKDKRLNNDNDQDNRSNNNLDNRIVKFNDLIGTNNVQRIPLIFLVDLGLVNFPVKFDTKFVFRLEQILNKLFELRRELDDATVPNNLDAKIIFHVAPYMQQQQFKLTDNFRKYLEESLLSKRVLRTGIKPTPYQKSYKIYTGIQSFIVDFKGSYKEFSFTEVSLVYDKSNQNSSLYDSFNCEIGSIKIDSIKSENVNNNYSVSNEIKFDLNNDNNKFLLYCQIPQRHLLIMLITKNIDNYQD